MKFISTPFCSSWAPRFNVRRAFLPLLLSALFSFYACTDHREVPQPQTLPDRLFYVLNDANQLMQVNLRNTNSPVSTVALTGLQSGEKMLSIDFRPATGQLYGVGSTSRLYVINPMNGAARALGGGAFSPALNGEVVGFDFNPTVDRIRLVTSNGQNLRLNPETGGVVATDGDINGVPGVALAGSAYTNNVAGATTTVLYNLDPNTDQLYRQDPPNAGTQVPVGSLQLNITAVGGFDIDAVDGTAIASVTFEGKSELQRIDLGTGRAQKLGNLPGTIVGLAIPVPFVYYVVDNTNALTIYSGTSVSTKSITGLQSGETVLGIDFRPVNGQLYALGSTSRLYTINTSNGAATVVGGAPFATPLAGTDFGFDFNPTVDRIRVISNTGQNLRLHPETGALVMADGNLNGAATNGTATAYTNNFAGATATTMYVINHETGRLYRQDPPNNGTLIDIGPLNVAGGFEAGNGFDIGGMSNTAYAVLRSGGTSRVYTVDVTTGAASPVNAAGTPPGTMRGFAVGLGF